MKPDFDMFGYRAIERIEMGKTVTNDPGPPPEVLLLRPEQLVVNEEYQRSLSKASLLAIKRMAAEFDWDSYKALSVAATDSPGVYEVVDGQHTAIAARTNGLVPFLPCLLSRATDLRGKARGFVGINTKRIALTPMVIFNANVAAQDEDAMAVEVAMSRSGVSLLSLPPANGARWKPGETMAVGTMLALAKKSGDARLSTVLRIAVLAKAAPVSSLLIKALDVALPPEPTPIDRAKFVEALSRIGIGRLEVLAASETPPGRRTFDTMAEKIADAAGFPRRAGRPKRERRR